MPKQVSKQPAKKSNFEIKTQVSVKIKRRKKIPETAYKKPVATKYAKETMRRDREYWGGIFNFGTKERFVEIYLRQLNNLPIKHLLKSNKFNPQIMILGPGYGLDIPELHKQLNKSGVEPKIDTFGLKKELDANVRKSSVENEFAFNSPLELITPKNPEHAKFIKHVTNRYDLIVSSFGVGFHTYYPVQNSFRSAQMLTKGGEAFIQLPYEVYKDNFSYRSKQNRKDLRKLFQKLVDNYNSKNNTNLKFELEFVVPNAINTIKSLDLWSIYLRIKRIN